MLNAKCQMLYGYIIRNIKATGTNIKAQTKNNNKLTLAKIIRSSTAQHYRAQNTKKMGGGT